VSGFISVYAVMVCDGPLLATPKRLSNPPSEIAQTAEKLTAFELENESRYFPPCKASDALRLSMFVKRFDGPSVKRAHPLNRSHQSATVVGFERSHDRRFFPWLGKELAAQSHHKSNVVPEMSPN